MVSKICFLLIALCVLASSTVYNVNIKCGTCQSTSGCLANLCVAFTGDLQAEYCSNTSTCTFSAQESVQIGQCTSDFSGGICSSGVCMASASINMCYGSSAYGCLNGVKFYQSCSGSTLTISQSGGILGSTPIVTTMDISSFGQNSCVFSTATGLYSTCSTDAFGNNCGCCFSMSFTGMSTLSGSCVPSTSGIASIKSKLSSSSFEVYTFLPILMLLAVTMI